MEQAVFVVLSAYVLIHEGSLVAPLRATCKDFRDLVPDPSIGARLILSDFFDDYLSRINGYIAATADYLSWFLEAVIPDSNGGGTNSPFSMNIFFRPGRSPVYHIHHLRSGMWPRSKSFVIRHKLPSTTLKQHFLNRIFATSTTGVSGESISFLFVDIAKHIASGAPIQFNYNVMFDETL